MLMSAVDEAAIKYLHELLSEPNQTLITAAMRADTRVTAKTV